MENTTHFLFDNTDEKYFLAARGRAIGPLTAQDLYACIQKGEASLLHYVWEDGWADWKRIYDVREFTVLVPPKPSVASIDHIKETIKGKKKNTGTAAESDAKIYYTYFRKTQYGPFSKKELLHAILTQKIDRTAYLWTPGWPNWRPLSEVPEFGPQLASVNPPRPPELQAVKTSKTARADGPVPETMGVVLATQAGVDASDRREAPRRPLVARLFLHNDKDVIVAICRDISVGGMQVLTDRVPGGPGTRIKLNVAPSDAAQKVTGFVAEGEIVRVLEDGRGFSFRFLRISREAQQAIEKYIESDG